MVGVPRPDRDLAVERLEQGHPWAEEVRLEVDRGPGVMQGVANLAATITATGWGKRGTMSTSIQRRGW